MKRGLAALLGFLVLARAAASGGAIGPEAGATEWNFRVYLDDNEIGYHHYRVVDDGPMQKVTSEAEFEVKFLFITAYRYEHYNEETWRGECVAEISSTTDANGERFRVEGRRIGNRLEVSGADGSTDLPGCVKTFAYWDPGFLRAPRLMNSQTGELLPVSVEPVATEWLNVRGQATEARRYKLTARNMELDIWYSNDDRWLALESTVKGGRKLRYELT